MTKIRIMNRKELELLLSINPRNLHKQADRAPKLVLYLSLQHQTLFNTGPIAGVRLYFWKRSTGYD